MDVYKILADGKEELLYSGADPSEVDELREWLSYTKPLGPSFRIVARRASEDLFCLTSAGNEADSLKEENPPSRAA